MDFVGCARGFSGPRTWISLDAHVIFGDAGVAAPARRGNPGRARACKCTCICTSHAPAFAYTLHIERFRSFASAAGSANKPKRPRRTLRMLGAMLHGCLEQCLEHAHFTVHIERFRSFASAASPASRDWRRKWRRLTKPTNWPKRINRCWRFERWSPTRCSRRIIFPQMIGQPIPRLARSPDERSDIRDENAVMVSTQRSGGCAVASYRARAVTRRNGVATERVSPRISLRSSGHLASAALLGRCAGKLRALLFTGGGRNILPASWGVRSRPKCST